MRGVPIRDLPSERYPIFEDLTWVDPRDRNRCVYVSRPEGRRHLSFAVVEWSPRGGYINVGNYGSLRAAVTHALQELEK